MIFISNFFIRKLNTSKHWYVDGIFVYPENFTQLIVILYKDEILNKRLPGLFALINNKKYEGYKLTFEKIQYILTIENTIPLKLESYALDFEVTQQKTFLELFPGIKCVCCYYLYCLNLRDKARDYNLLNKENKETTNNLLKDLYKLPFIYNNNPSNFVEALNKWSSLDKQFINFHDFYQKQWVKYFKTNIFNYSLLKNDERSNSYIDNYNRIIKLKLSSYLYGKNHCRISWPLFIYFIKNEEEDCRLSYPSLEKDIIQKRP